MRKILFCLFLAPLALLAQEDYPDYSNGTGFPLAYLHPEYGQTDRQVIWLPWDEFSGEYGFEDICYVTRESENHGGGMSQSWNITFIGWEGNNFYEAWHVHYDTLYWDTDSFVQALPELEDSRYINGSTYELNDAEMLESWGFTGYGSGNQLLAEYHQHDSTYTVWVTRTEKYDTGEPAPIRFRELNSDGLPISAYGAAGERLDMHYHYNEEGDFMGFNPDSSFVDQLKAEPADMPQDGYRLFANGKHFEEVAAEKFGYHPDHILVGFWRFGYVHFQFFPNQKKYILTEIIPFF